MTLGESIESCFRNYVTFRGRASRSEYWYFVLFLVLVGIGLGMVDAYIGADGPDYGGYDGYGGGPQSFGPQSFGLFGALFTLATFLPSLAVAVRRLHDIDVRGWWLLLLVTGIGAIPLIVMLCWRSSQGDNRFGPPPA